MDIRGLRTLNLLGTISFCLIGFLLASAQLYQIITIAYHFPDSDFSICMGLLALWYCIIIVFTICLYNYTVLGLDRGNYKVAKQWTLIGIFVGFAGGLIPLIIFIISYVSFDDAIRIAHSYPLYPQPAPIRFCISCKRQIPLDSKLCPYCGVKQSAIPPPSRSTTPPRQSIKPKPEKKQPNKSQPPPPPWWKDKNDRQK